MAAVRPDQAKTGAADAIVGTPGTQVTPQPGRYEIDTGCSAVTFRTRHLFGIAPVRGSFAVRAGTVDVAEPLAGSSVYVQIDPASFRTGNGQRDNNVRSERLLDVGRYPAITFRSENVDGPALTGTLTVRNVTMPVTLSIEQTAVTPGSFNAHASTRRAPYPAAPGTAPPVRPGPAAPGCQAGVSAKYRGGREAQRGVPGGRAPG